MTDLSYGRTGLLILRVWMEDDTRAGLRARLTQTNDVSGAGKTIAIAATPEDIYAAVAEWVEGFVTLN